MRSPHKLLSPSTVTTENNQVFGFNAPSPLTVSSSSAAVTTLFYSPPSIPEQPEAEFTNGHTYNHTHNDVGGELEYQKKEVRFLSLFSTHSHYYFFFTLFFQNDISKRMVSPAIKASSSHTNQRLSPPTNRPSHLRLSWQQPLPLPVSSNVWRFSQCEMYYYYYLLLIFQIRILFIYLLLPYMVALLIIIIIY